MPKLSSLDIAAQKSLQERCRESFNAHLEAASRYFQEPIPTPELRFDLRGRAAGQCRMAHLGGAHDACIRINAQLLDQYGDAFIAEVIPHELGHFLAYVYYGARIRPHGKEWRAMVEQVLGAEANVTHRFETNAARTMRYYEYACACEGKVHALSAIRHGKVQKARAAYRCKACATILSIR